MDCYDDYQIVVRKRFNPHGLLLLLPLQKSAFWIPSSERDPRGRESNQEKETEIETHVLKRPPHNPKISAGMSSSTERRPASGRNLNARGHAAHAHRHRFPGLGAMTKQRYFNAQSYRNRRRRAAGESPAGLIPVQLHKSLSPAEVYPHRNFGLCVGGITPSVTISASLLWLLFPLSRIPPRSGIQERDFGGAKKVTDGFVGQSRCVVPQGINKFFSGTSKELGCLPKHTNERNYPLEPQ